MPGLGVRDYSESQDLVDSTKESSVNSGVEISWEGGTANEIRSQVSISKRIESSLRIESTAREYSTIFKSTEIGSITSTMSN
jgi:hypothetical protein